MMLALPCSTPAGAPTELSGLPTTPLANPAVELLPLSKSHRVEILDRFPALEHLEHAGG
jgi:hypothetical protein